MGGNLLLRKVDVITTPSCEEIQRPLTGSPSRRLTFLTALAVLIVPSLWLLYAGSSSSHLATEAKILLPRAATDALGNTTAADNDYRVLQPFRVTDPNGNRSEVAFDCRGMVGMQTRGELHDRRVEVKKLRSVVLN